MASPRSTHTVDITTTIERKLAALRCHRSQLAGAEDLEEMIHTWGTATATALALPDGRLAEGFQVVDTAEAGRESGGAGREAFDLPHRRGIATQVNVSIGNRYQATSVQHINTNW